MSRKISDCQGALKTREYVFDRTFLVILPGFWPLGGACRRALVRIVFYMAEVTLSLLLLLP